MITPIFRKFSWWWMWYRGRIYGPFNTDKMAEDTWHRWNKE